MEDYGTRLGEKVTKHLEEDIWEVRPEDNRVLFFFFKEDTYMLLYHFRKKTKKTPRREIQRANMELSQRDLARLCGIPQSSVARIESGVTTPKLSTLLKIFHQLGLSLSVQPIISK